MKKLVLPIKSPEPSGSPHKSSESSGSFPPPKPSGLTGDVASGEPLPPGHFLFNYLKEYTFVSGHLFYRVEWVGFAEPPSGRGWWLAARDLPANMKMGWLREGQKVPNDRALGVSKKRKVRAADHDVVVVLTTPLKKGQARGLLKLDHRIFRGKLRFPNGLHPINARSTARKKGHLTPASTKDITPVTARKRLREGKPPQVGKKAPRHEKE
ncbi:hypothetical protein PAPYR_11516 [Paratrimastix pyriformis]|uniref:Chromo domain-containing protein n=1 Tax=Paratrimastix pyriformis TaxID=342808 RepID=A0ABQ8U2A1_9EUKA|nr:hypothetical protein PAPYR_12177 [Paratrimastix pyriformis]KAJ4453899.1 hypothetical protein PAPYR_11516 [Paratrimastix pyriformis]